MNDYEKIWDFGNLYKAHKAARRGKQDTKEVIDFECRLAENLTKMSDRLRKKEYRIKGYYSFAVYDPKYRIIHALHYEDRVFQHCLCDEVLAPCIDKKLIYDNAACRIGKGTHFAIRRVNRFLHEYYQKHGSEGYFLKCDVKKFFDNIDHGILKCKLKTAIDDEDVYELLCMVIDSFHADTGVGLPLGNQTSQWFAIYYLDGLDRFIKEKLKIKYYSRYMDDMVLIHNDKSCLKSCLKEMRSFIESDCKLEFNQKTQITPIKNGVNYLGWHFYLTDTGKIVRYVSNKTKNKYKRRLKKIDSQYNEGKIDLKKADEVINSYHAHLSHGHTYRLRKKLLKDFRLYREYTEN